MLLHANVLGKGTPFVILHGFLGMSDNWKTLGRKFSQEAEVHLVDQRNHGRSFHADEFNYDILAEDLKRYCQAHQLKNIVLLGHSMGGKTAMFFAAKYPHLVSKLIIADIAPRFYPIHHHDILNGLSALNFNVLKTRQQSENALAQYVSEPGVRQFLLKNLYWVHKGQLALRINLNVLKAKVAQVGEALPNNLKFTGPTLFLKGENSSYITAQDTQSIPLQFPKALVKTISNAGHWLHAENPRAFYEEVSLFLG